MDVVSDAFDTYSKKREQTLESIFGKTFPAGEIFSPSISWPQFDWRGEGVLQFPPSKEFSSWIYLTTGLSQPDFEDSGQPIVWKDDSGISQSGFGIELAISTAHESNWVIGVLYHLLRYMIFSPGSRPILPGHRFPIDVSNLSRRESLLNHFIAIKSDRYRSQFALPAGECNIVHLVGITSKEAEYATSLGNGIRGSQVLYQVLSRVGMGIDSVLDRSCLTEDPRFYEVWDQVASEK